VYISIDEVISSAYRVLRKVDKYILTDKEAIILSDSVFKNLKVFFKRG